MAVSGRKKKGGFGWLLFWLAFIIGTVFLFVINREKVQNGLAVLKDLFNEPVESPSVPKPEDLAPPAAPPVPETSAGTGETSPLPEIPAAQPQIPVARDTAQEIRQTPERNEQAASRSVERYVYMIRLDRDGDLAAARVERSLPSSDSPMQDALEAAIKGPSALETKRNLLSLIPRTVKILGATVRGSTAYINFNEDFLFNTYGIEGYAGQLRQVVWTATEFSNVKDVQILIDGKRMDYLGEGIWIGSPLSRDSL